MELNEIVETKFLPPESVQDYGVHSDFGVKVADDGFIPWTSNLDNSEKKYFIDKAGKYARSEDLAIKEIFDTIEKARKHVWKYFNHNRKYYSPALQNKPKATQNETK